MKDFHLNGIREAEHANALPPSERKFYSSFVALSEDQFESIQKLVQDFNEKIVAYFDEPTVHEKKIYRLNFQVLPVSGRIHKKKLEPEI